ncbi:hypothetical protein T12_10355 [Trichinella patagoniensis]|uniref:Uncharacterized protein n=1 Tax=Trichinella patagoniensis TaxID=990121 RepID=A0A0V0YTT9_9BILA|nr:hypothetical protein T12_10355 [Trichinella patagoniensis]
MVFTIRRLLASTILLVITRFTIIRLGGPKCGKSVRSTIRSQPCHTNYRRNNGQSKPN